MRILRSYIRVAQTLHWCDRCLRDIEPGECYEGSVQIHGKRLMVFKEHVNPACDYPKDPLEDEIEYNEQRDSPSQLAA